MGLKESLGDIWEAVATTAKGRRITARHGGDPRTTLTFAAPSAPCFATRALISTASSKTKCRISSPRLTVAFSYPLVSLSVYGGHASTHSPQ